MRKGTYQTEDSSELRYLIIEAADITRAETEDPASVAALLADLPAGPLTMGIVREHDDDLMVSLARACDVVTATRRNFGPSTAVPVRVLAAITLKSELIADYWDGLCIHAMPVGGEEQIYVVQLQDDVVIFGPTVESASAVSYREALESLAPSALGQALSGAN